MTSYLTPIDTFSLSRTVFEIFDFKVFRVWPWPLEVTRGQKYFHHSKAPYMTSYFTSIGICSLSRTVFEIFDFKVFRVWPWPLTFRGHPRSKNIYTIWKPIYDFLSNSHWHFLSISYRFWDIRLLVHWLPRHLASDAITICWGSLYSHHTNELILFSDKFLIDLKLIFIQFDSLSRVKYF